MFAWLDRLEVVSWTNQVLAMSEDEFTADIEKQRWVDFEEESESASGEEKEESGGEEEESEDDNLGESTDG